MTDSERSLLEQARAGDRTAFGKLVRLHHPRVHRLATHLTGNSGEADDVTQETFVRAWKAIERFDGRAELFTWLYRICVNVALNARRSRKRETTDIHDPRLPEPIAEGRGADPALHASQAEGYRILLRAIDSLSESLRTTLLLACVENVPYADIASVLGCTEGTVAWRVHEARRKLREVLGDQWMADMDALDTDQQPKKGGAHG
jgi:RNA polymerase sigma-70 factor (ECF subfamily)